MNETEANVAIQMRQLAASFVRPEPPQKWATLEELSYALPYFVDFHELSGAVAVCNCCEGRDDFLVSNFAVNVCQRCAHAAIRLRQRRTLASREGTP